MAKYAVEVQYDAVPATTTEISPAETEEEFERFEELTSKLLKVTKPELDEKLSEH